MKNSLLIPLALLSFCVFAEDRLIIGSFEQESAKRYLVLSYSSESSLNGFGLRLYEFQDSGLYFGTSFAHLTDDGGLSCPPLPVCASANYTATMFSGESGWVLDRWTPFIGTSYSHLEEEIHGVGRSGET